MKLIATFDLAGRPVPLFLWSHFYFMAVVYIHKRLDTNEVFYVGIGKTTKRAFDKSKRSIHWKRVVNKTNYIVTILFENLTWEEACQKEIELIKQYGRADLNEGALVNMTDGGEGSLNVNVTEETRKKIIESNKKRTISDETKKKISEAKKGYPAWNKGIPLSDSVKLSLSKTHKGKKVSDETRKKLSEANKGKKHSEETKAKMKKPHKKKITWTKD
jgi:hypothetical protein